MVLNKNKIYLIFFLLSFYSFIMLSRKEEKKKVYENKLTLLKLMTNNNILQYKGFEECLLNDPESLLCFYPFIAPKKVKGKNRILFGTKGDGSYVLLDDFKDIKIAYSFGISDNIQFDKCLADKGIDVYMYDHTISGLPYQNPKFHWTKVGLAGKGESTPKLKTLEELIIINNHSLEKNMILKIDIEHSEWSSLKDLSYDILKKFKYIVMEFHFSSIKEMDVYYTVLKKMNKFHQVFYLRCNNRNYIIRLKDLIICRLLEVSYVIKENNEFIKDDDIYPIFEFDFPEAQNNSQLEFNLNILKLFDNIYL